MGNSANHLNENFFEDWVQMKDQRLTFSDQPIWVNKNNRSLQMQEYQLNVTSQQQLQQEQKVYLLRKNHSQIVSSLYFKDQTEDQFCASNYKGKIYIERIPLTLESITDVPFPDALHIYSQSLQGFYVLASQVEGGCFPISEENIGINCQSVCKVWMNNLLNRNYPGRNERILEQRMVRMILDTIQENVDLVSLQGRPSPKIYIYSKAKTVSDVRFSQAINLLRNYANEYFGGNIADRLACVDKVGGSDFLSNNWQGPSTAPVQRGQIMKTRNVGPVYGRGVSLQETNQHINLNPGIVRSNFADNSFNESLNYTAFRRQEPLSRPNNNLDVREVSNYKNQKISATNQFSGLSYAGLQPSQATNPTEQPLNALMNQQRIETHAVRLPSIPQNNQSISPIFISNYTDNRVGEARIGMITSTAMNPFQPQQVSQFASSYQIQANQGVLIRPSQAIVTGRFEPVNQLQQGGNVVVRDSSSEIRKSTIVFVKPGAPTSLQSVTQSPQLHLMAQAVKINQDQTAYQQINQDYTANRQISQDHPTNQANSQIKEKIAGGQSSSLSPELNRQRSVALNEQMQKVNQKLVFVHKKSSITRPEIQQRITQTSQQLNSTIANQNSSYETFTSKLYDRDLTTTNEDITKTANFKSNNDYYSTKKLTEKLSTSKLTENKYSVKLDDGMSSPDFLNELKNLKSSSLNTNKGSSSTFDYTLYQPTSYIGRNLDTNQDSTHKIGLTSGIERQQKYEVEFQNFSQNFFDKNKLDNGLGGFGQNVNYTTVPSNNERLSDEVSYRMSYEYQQVESPSGNLHQKVQTASLQGEQRTQEEKYYRPTDYTSVFHKYANYSELEVQGREERGKYSNYQQQSPAQELYRQRGLQEEYKVDYDPEILADLQRLKGPN